MSKNKPRRRRSTLVSAILLAAMCVALGAVILLRLSAGGSQAVPAAVTLDSPAPPSTGGQFTPAPTATPVQGAQDTEAPTASPEPTPEPEPEYFTISMVGDCSMASNPDKKGWAIAYESVLNGDMSYPFANQNIAQYVEEQWLALGQQHVVEQMSVVRQIHIQELLHSLTGQADLHTDHFFPVFHAALYVFQLDGIGIRYRHIRLHIRDPADLTLIHFRLAEQSCVLFVIHTFLPFYDSDGLCIS